MKELMKKLERLYSVTHVPLILLNNSGKYLAGWPDFGAEIVADQAREYVLENFRLQKGDYMHPLITFMDPGYFLGIVEANDDCFILAGLISPIVQSRSEVLAFASEAVRPENLQGFCDALLQVPLMSLTQLKEFICLAAALAGNAAISEEHIIFVDETSVNRYQESAPEREVFRLRETADTHVPTTFEAAIISAIEKGDRYLLERGLYAPHGGRVGRMSLNSLRQEKYSFICLATLISRAAIRGGLPEEISFSLSDLYCQRADLLSDVVLIQQLVVSMLMDYCERVRLTRNKPTCSPVTRKCLQYISDHLHESVTLDELSRSCGLCTRSLSLRFREEMGMGIPEYINQEKMKEADFLLCHTDYTLSAIASFLHYPSQSYFTKIFKKYRQVTPYQFRNRPADNDAARGK